MWTENYSEITKIAKAKMRKLLTDAVCRFVFVYAVIFLLPSCSVYRSTRYYSPTINEYNKSISVREYVENDTINLDSLKKLYGKNKLFIPTCEKQSLIALSYYPELQTIHIKFVYANISTTMACRPTSKGVLLGKRHYKIFINNNPDFEGILLQDVPYNAQIGVIGHEICHVLDYEKRNIIGVVQRGINYLTRNSKRTYERSIDKLTIQRGLGWQLYDWADFSMFKSLKATEKYKEFKRDIYMLPNEIEKEIKCINSYDK